MLLASSFTSLVGNCVFTKLVGILVRVTMLPICAYLLFASCETIMLHQAKWSHSAAQGWQYYEANCQHTGKKGSNITTIRWQYWKPKCIKIELEALEYYAGRKEIHMTGASTNPKKLTFKKTLIAWLIVSMYNPIILFLIRPQLGPFFQLLDPLELFFGSG